MKNYLLIILALLCFSCKKEQRETPTIVIPQISNVLILGNSITLAPANPSIGWTNTCGMAATTPENDYVHLLTAKLRTISPNVNVQIRNIATFESNYMTYNLSDNLSMERDFNADLVILRLGENVQEDTLNNAQFVDKYTKLVEFVTIHNPKARILSVGSFWLKAKVDSLMETVMANKKGSFITLNSLGTDMSNYSFSVYSDHGVGLHPNDKCMGLISGMIWDEITEMYQSK